jgi:hypothetical protein
VDRLLKDVNEAIRQVEPLLTQLRTAEASQPGIGRLADAAGKRLTRNPVWDAMVQADGLVSVLLARFELVLQQAAQIKDYDKAMRRFCDHMEGGGRPEGYFTDGSLAAGVVDMGVDVGLVTPPEAAVLKLKRPWWKSPFYVKDCADYIDLVVNNVKAVVQRIESCWG